MKRFFRCNVCGDIHFGNNAPEKCPTCNAMHAYVHVSDQEAGFVQEFIRKDELTGRVTDKDELLQTWKDFAKDSTCRLTGDEEMLGTLLDSVLTNEKKSGLRICPCRISDGSREKDLDLLCPCNFYAQETWRAKSECWCGLFVKERHDG